MSEFKDLISKYSKLNNKFLVISSDEEKLPKIKDGIVFILATWSGASIERFILLTEILANMELEGMKLYVFDTDNLNPEALISQGIGLPQGWGETYWIKNYKIFDFLTKYNEEDSKKIISNTIEIID